MNDEQAKQWVYQQLQSGQTLQQIAATMATGGAPQDMIMRILGPIAQAMQQQQAAAAPSFGGAPGFGGAGIGAPQGQVPQSVIDKVGAALGGAKDGNASGRKLPDGIHLCRTIQCKFAPTFYAPAGKFFHVFEVLESTSPHAEIGGKYDDSMDPNDQFGYGLNDIRGFLNMAVEAKLKNNARVQWDARFFAWAIADQQPIAGQLWRIESHEQQAKKSSNTFVKCEYSIVPDGTTTLGLTTSAAAPAQTSAVAMAPGGQLPANLFGAPAATPQFGAPPAAASPAAFSFGAPAATPQFGVPQQGTPMTPGAVPSHIAAMFGK